jgi:hypothetical protein
MAMNLQAGSASGAAAPADLLSWMWVTWIEVIDLMRKRKKMMLMMKRENKDSGVRMEMMMMMELALQVGAWMQIHFQ